MSAVKKFLKLGLLPKKLINGSKHKKNYNKAVNEDLIHNTNYVFPRCKKLVIVAHPDDETIFAGKYLVHNRNDVLVVCLTNAKNEARHHEFKQVMDYLNLPYLMFDFPDCEFGYDQKWEESLPLIKEVLTKIKNTNNFDEVLTHNKDGEYGHQHHKVLNKVVKEIFNNVKVFSFSTERISTEIQLEKEKMYSFYHSQKNVLKNNKTASRYFFYEGMKEE